MFKDLFFVFKVHSLSLFWHHHLKLVFFGFSQVKIDKATEASYFTYIASTTIFIVFRY